MSTCGTWAAKRRESLPGRGPQETTSSLSERLGLSRPIEKSAPKRRAGQCHISAKTTNSAK